MAQKLSCCLGRHLGQGRASQPGVGAEAVLMAPEAEDGFREAEAEACIHLDYVSHVEPASFLLLHSLLAIYFCKNCRAAK